MVPALKKIFASAATVTVLCFAPDLAGAPLVAPQTAVEVTASGDGVSVLPVARDRTCPKVLARSRHSLYIEGLQEKFGHVPGHTPLVVLDHDEIERCQGYLAADSSMTGKFSGYNRALFDFIRAKGGVALPPGEIQGRAEDMLAGKISAEVFFDGRGREKLTVLIPNNPDMSVYDALLDFATTDAGRKGYEFLGDALRSQKAVSAEVFRLWGDVHEIAHALDRHYKPAIWKAGGIDLLWHKHKTEMYADVVSVLYLASSGKTQGPEAARFIADLRTVNTVSPGGHDSGLALDHQLSAVYHTAPGLRAAANYISGAGRGIKGLPIDKILKVAQAIVEENALTREEMRAVIDYMDHGRLGYLEGLARMSDSASRDVLRRAVDAYDDEVALSRERIRKQIEDYAVRNPTTIEKEEVDSGIYTDLLLEVRKNDSTPEAFARRIASLKDELRESFVYGASTIDEEHAQKYLEDVGRVTVDYAGELAEKGLATGKAASGAKPRPKSSRTKPQR